MKAKMHSYSDFYTKSSKQRNVCTHDLKILSSLVTLSAVL